MDITVTQEFCVYYTKVTKFSLFFFSAVATIQRVTPLATYSDILR